MNGNVLGKRVNLGVIELENTNNIIGPYHYQPHSEISRRDGDSQVMMTAMAMMTRQPGKKPIVSSTRGCGCQRQERVRTGMKVEQ